MSSGVSAAECLKYYSHKYLEIRCFQFTLLAANAVSQIDSDREHVDVTKITDKLCKLKPTDVMSVSSADMWKNFLNHTEFYNKELEVQLALRIN